MTLATPITRLIAMADRLQHQAELIRNSSYNPKAEALGGDLADDAFAIRAVLKERDELLAQVANFKEGKVDGG